VGGRADHGVGIGKRRVVLIVAGIIDAVPGVGRLLKEAATDAARFIKVIVLAAVYMAIVIGVNLHVQGQRRIPMQSAKQMKAAG